MNIPQQQMLLDLKPEQAPTLENFVVGTNGELLQRLRDLCDSHSFEALYLWGAAGSGKSHLLAATAAAAAPNRPVAFLNAAEAGAELSFETGSLLVIDDIEALTAEARSRCSAPSMPRASPGWPCCSPARNRRCGWTCAKTCAPVSARP